MLRVDTNGNEGVSDHSVVWRIMLVLAGIAGALYLVIGVDMGAKPPKEVPAAAPAPELPCVQEECSERARWFVCEESYTYYCARYRVDYERACVCTKRGAP